jgi:uncharacterized protein
MAIELERPKLQRPKLQRPKLERRCVSCQRVADRREFWRIVSLPIDKNTDKNTGAATGKKAVIDLGETSPRPMGRSAYICRQYECLNVAQKKNKLGRSLRIPVAPEIYVALKALPNE